MVVTHCLDFLHVTLKHMKIAFAFKSEQQLIESLSQALEAARDQHNASRHFRIHFVPLRLFISQITFPPFVATCSLPLGGGHAFELPTSICFNFFKRAHLPHTWPDNTQKAVKPGAIVHTPTNVRQRTARSGDRISAPFVPMLTALPLAFCQIGHKVAFHVISHQSLESENG